MQLVEIDTKQTIPKGKYTNNSTETTDFLAYLKQIFASHNNNLLFSVEPICEELLSQVCNFNRKKYIKCFNATQLCTIYSRIYCSKDPIKMNLK